MGRLTLVWLFCLLCVSANDTVTARIRGGTVAVAAVAGCVAKGGPQNDFGGTPDDCANSTQHPAFQNVSFFGTGAGNARQSNQGTYFYNDSTITWNIPCIDNGCAYDTTKLNKDPADISFSASTGTITSGVMTISDASLDATYGNISVGQYIGTGATAPTISSPKTVSLTSHTGGVQVWQLDQSATVAGTPTIHGMRFPQIGCDYRTTIAGISSVPIVNCPTTSDTTTPTLIDGYDGTLEGIWLRIVVGAGGGSTGVAGPVTVSNNSFIGTTACNTPSISTGVGTHFDFYILHNKGDSNYPTCTQTSFLNNQTVGTSLKSQILDIEWNAIINQPIDPMAGNGNFTGITIANNWSNGCLSQVQCSPTALHGAMYANSVSAHMDYYIYKHNTMLWESGVGASSVTTSYSILALGGSYQAAIIDSVKFLGNIAVVNCSGGACTGTNQTAQNALWANNDPVAWGSLISTSNLVDPTGANVVYVGGNARLKNTASLTSFAGTVGLAFIDVTVNQDNWQPNSFVHPNSTPLTFNGTIAPSGIHDGLGLLTLDAPNVSLGLNSVAGILVPPGMYITTVVDTSHFKVANWFGTDDSHLTAVHQAMYTAFTVLDSSTVIDPRTGVHPTGTGTNTGSYAVPTANTGAVSAVATWNRFNPTIGTYPATVNDGTDRQLTDGSPRYIGGQIWNAGIAP